MLIAKPVIIFADAEKNRNERAWFSCKQQAEHKLLGIGHR
jgi:hypothetical protein